MIQEFKAVIDLFKEGKAVTNPKIWKSYQVLGTTITGLLGSALVIARGFGYDIYIDDKTLGEVGVGIAAIVHLGSSIITVISSEKIGIPASHD